MKIIFFLLTVTIPVLAFAQANDTVHHPAPKEPKFISAGLYDGFKSRLPNPPITNSAAQQSDEEGLFALQKSRTAEDCAQAKEEVFVSLKSFYGKPQGPLESADVEQLSAFFDQVRNDGDFFIQKMKIDFPRQRPFAYVQGITPCVPKEVTGAYPSGHAMLSELYALILGDLYPAQKEQFEVRAREIGMHRVLSGMHHPSDVESGRLLAKLVYEELTKSENYQAAFKNAAGAIGNPK